MRKVDVAGRHDAETGQFEAHLELELLFGGGRKQAAFLEPGGRDRGLGEVGHLLGGQGLGIEDQIEEFGGGLGLAELGFAVGAVGGFQIQQQLAGGGALQAAIQHQVADAHILRRHHVDAQHAGEVAALQFAADGAEDEVVLGGQARQNRGHQAGIGLVGNLGVRAELLAGERADAGLRQQLEAQPLRAEPRHLLETAPRMTRNRDQRHVTSSS